MRKPRLGEASAKFTPRVKASEPPGPRSCPLSSGRPRGGGLGPPGPGRLWDPGRPAPARGPPRWCQGGRGRCPPAPRASSPEGRGTPLHSCGGGVAPRACGPRRCPLLSEARPLSQQRQPVTPCQAPGRWWRGRRKPHFPRRRGRPRGHGWGRRLDRAGSRGAGGGLPGSEASPRSSWGGGAPPQEDFRWPGSIFGVPGAGRLRRLGVGVLTSYNKTNSPLITSIVRYGETEVQPGPR